MLYSYIAIEGNIGAGKTTLASLFAEKLNAKLVLEEFAENPFLPKFYDNPEKYSFQLELSFLAERYQQILKELENRNLFQQVVISDYIINKSRIFAKTNLDRATYKLYNQLYQLIIKSMPKPELILYLNNDSDKLLSNISKRGRDYEQNIKADYLNRIHKNYSTFFKQQRKLRVLMIDANNLDFVSNNQDFESLFNLLNDVFPRGITDIKL